jgi:hypothetical protein
LSQVKKVKNVSPNWLNFLWQDLHQIRLFQRNNQYSEALYALAWFIKDWLPEDLKDKHEKTADQVIHTMRLIGTGKIRQIAMIPDVYQRRSYKILIMTKYASAALDNLVNGVMKDLEDRGYIEARDRAAEGWSQSMDREMETEMFDKSK